VLTLNGQHRRSVELADRVLEIAEREDLVPIIAESLVTKGTALGSLGRGYEAIGALQTGRQLAETRGLIDTALRALINLGVTLGDRDPRAAFEATGAALEQARRVGDRGAALFVLANAAEGAVPVGEWDWALTQLAEALSTDLDASNRAIFLMGRAPVLAFRGESVDEDLAEA